MHYCGPPTNGPGSAAPRFEIKKWNAVTMWSWDICADTCAICRNNLNEPSIEYQANPSPNNENGLSIAFGCCGHVFHLDCIQVRHDGPVSARGGSRLIQLPGRS